MVLEKAVRIVGLEPEALGVCVQEGAMRLHLREDKDGRNRIENAVV